MDEELKKYLDNKFLEVYARLDVMTESIDERTRDMQTELLRGFEAFSTGQTIRLRKVEADHSNLDTALSGRVDIVEGRLRQIELRLGLDPKP